MGGINSICINGVSVQKNLGQHPLGTKQTARNNDGGYLMTLVIEVQKPFITHDISSPQCCFLSRKN